MFFFYSPFFIFKVFMVGYRLCSEKKKNQKSSLRPVSSLTQMPIVWLNRQCSAGDFTLASRLWPPSSDTTA
jgi:hypothetical protein